jgi:hypothetical protein
MDYILVLFVGIALGNASMLIALGLFHRRRIDLGIERAIEQAGA